MVALASGVQCPSDPPQVAAEALSCKEEDDGLVHALVIHP
jgi:hypothetical protein